MAEDLIVLRPQGLYCPPGDFYIDPWRPVETAVITHAHADHARPGSLRYHCSAASLPLLQWRLGPRDYQPHQHGERFPLGGATVSLHPAGHVLGSVQVRVEYQGEVWVASGDYKRQADPTCAPFEVVACDVLITEATFALPVYRWPDPARVARDIVAWRDTCAARGEAALLLCYGLGKSQRVLAEIAHWTDRPALLHGAVAPGVAIYRQAGVAMLDTETVAEQAKGRSYAGELILAPPSAAGSTWVRRFGPLQTGFVSGWMQIRGNRRRRNHDRGFVISDHADWPALLQTIEQTGARRIIATHGDTEALVRYLRERGLAAQDFHTEFGQEDLSEAEALVGGLP